MKKLRSYLVNRDESADHSCFRGGHLPNDKMMDVFKLGSIAVCKVCATPYIWTHHFGNEGGRFYWRKVSPRFARRVIKRWEKGKSPRHGWIHTNDYLGPG